jgi:hypothetical protein
MILLRTPAGVCDARCHEAAPGSDCECICGGDLHATGSFDAARRELIARALGVDDSVIDSPEESAQMLARLHRDAELDALGGDRRSEEAIKRHNVTVDPLRGNARQAALRKLRRDSPELHGQVISGELSPHAAHGADESAYEAALPGHSVAFYRERCEHPGMRLSMLTRAAVRVWSRERAEAAR